MGLYDDFGALIPEDKREAFKGAIDGLVKIDSREVVDKLAESNDFVKSWKDAVISKATASHDENFKRNTLPTLIEEEIKKRAPKPKDPEVAASLERIEKLEKTLAEKDRAIFLSNQRAKVLPKITELGLEAEWADRLIGNDDTETELIVDKFYKAMSKSREEYATKVLRDKFGNQAVPTMGGAKPTTIEALKTQYADLMNKKQFQQALMISDKIKQMEKLNG